MINPSTIDPEIDQAMLDISHQVQDCLGQQDQFIAYTDEAAEVAQRIRDEAVAAERERIIAAICDLHRKVNVDRQRTEAQGLMERGTFNLYAGAEQALTLALKAVRADS